MRALLLLTVLSAFAPPAQGQQLEVIGYAGVLGEWELTASVSERTSGRTRELHGPLKMRHVGVCTQSGPEEKTGEIRMQISGLFSSLNATVLIDGVACTYSARLSDAYKGQMNCPERAPLPLTLWIR